MDSAYIFVDTNILLHYQPIEDIPWKDILDVDEAVICVAPVVIEVDSGAPISFWIGI